MLIIVNDDNIHFIHLPAPSDSTLSYKLIKSENPKVSVNEMLLEIALTISSDVLAESASIFFVFPSINVTLKKIGFLSFVACNSSQLGGCVLAPFLYVLVSLLSQYGA